MNMLYLIIGFVLTLTTLKVLQYKFPEQYQHVYQEYEWVGHDRVYSTDPVRIIASLVFGTFLWVLILVGVVLFGIGYGFYKVMKF